MTVALSRQLQALDLAFAALATATTSEESLRALKTLRNALIGNNVRKAALCANHGFVRRLLECISKESEARAQIQLEAITILSILPIPDDDAMLSILHCNVHNSLWHKMESLALDTITPTNLAMKLAVLKALQAIFSCLHQAVAHVNDVWAPILLGSDNPKPIVLELTPIPKRPVGLAQCAIQAVFSIEDPNVEDLLSILTSLQRESSTIADAHLQLATTAAAFLADTIRHPQLQAKFNTFNLINRTDCPPFLVALLSLLDYSNSTSTKIGKLREAVCGAISALVRDNGEIASRVQTTLTKDNGLVVDLICNLARDPDPALSLAASCCATTLFKAIAIEPESIVLHLLRSAQIKPILGVLLRLLHQNTQIASSAAANLGYLVSNDAELQEVACDMGVLPELQKLLLKSFKPSQEQCSARERNKRNVALREAVLMAVALLSLEQEKIRKQVVQADLLPLIVLCLSDPSSSSIRAAACQCARGLSRSLNVLRTHLVDAGAAGPLLDLLKDEESLIVQSVAAATCANLLIEYSPMKEALLSRNALPRFVQLTLSTDPKLRVHALFALKNLTCWASSGLKELIIQHMTYDGLVLLALATDEETQAQALGILRNFASTRSEDIQAALDGIGEARFLQLVEDKLCSPFDEVVFQTIYIVLNATSSSRAHSLFLGRAGITRALLSHLGHSRNDIRQAAVRATKNLAAREPSQRLTNDNALRLRALGFESRLREMTNDASIDIREHVRLCLELFQQGDFRSDPHAIQVD